MIVIFCVNFFYYFIQLDDKYDGAHTMVDGNTIHSVSYKVLHSCNIWKNKNKNNNTMLKSGEGKLMMTNGISISDFAKKHNL